MRFSREKQKIGSCGFTLIELLVVLAILGVLTTLSFFGLQGARESARDNRRKTDLEAIRSALELYRYDCGRYPSSLGSQLRGDGSPGCPSSNFYLSEVPTDPQSPNRRYSYTSSAPYSTYVLCASLEGTSGSVSGCGSCGQACNYRVTNP